MKVLLYSESLDKISKSGLGKAIKHQIMALESVGIDYTLDPEDEFDILHINTYFPQSMLFATKCRDQGIPIVYHAHSTREDFENSFIFSNQLAPFFKMWLVACYKLGDILITPTPYSKRLLDEYKIKREIIALSNGIELDKFQPIPTAKQELRAKYQLPEDAFVVIGIGLYIERKGILDFIELAKQLPHIHFIWFGYTDLLLVPTKIRDAVNNPPSNLIFAGYVENTEINLALQGANLFLFTTYEETEGIPAIEACAAKADFIVRDIPVFEDWLIDRENVYKAQDLDEFHFLVTQAYKGQLPSLAAPAYKVAQEREIQVIGQKLAYIYQRAQVIASQRKPNRKRKFKHK